MEEQSKRFSVNSQDIVKIFQGALIAGIGAGATYLITEVGKLNLGQYTPFVAAIAAILLNALRKWVAGPGK